ncbi:MICOS complex subunit MIC27 isoform X1 [Arapaima gigas]
MVHDELRKVFLPQDYRSESDQGDTDDSQAGELILAGGDRARLGTDVRASFLLSFLLLRGTMAVKALKRAGVPAALGLGLASFRVYAVSQTGEEEEEDRLPPQELSIYAPPVQNLRYVEEQPGFLQRTFSRLRLGMQNVEFVFHLSNIIRCFFRDTRHFPKDGSAGFVLRLGAITVCGLAGLVLARKGSRLKRLGVPLGTAAVGAALCFPAQTVGVLKLTGKNIHAASQWSSSAVMSLWKTPGSAKEAIIQPAVLKGVRVADSEVKEPNAKLLTEVQPAEQALPSSDKPSSIPAPVEEVTSEFGPEVDLMEKTPACTVETTSQLFTLQPDVPGHTECISTLISHPENPIMNESVPPAKLKPEFPPGPEPVPLPVPEPEHVIVKESVPTSTPEPSLSSIPKSVPQPIPEPELPTVKESIPAHILERELPTPTAPPLISQPVSTSLPSTVSTPLEEPSPPFEPTFLPAEELLQISLEPEPEPKPSVATECGSLEDSTSDPTLEAELATEAALIHIDELLPIFAAPDPVELPTPPCLETPKSAVVVDTLAGKSPKTSAV